MAAPKGGSQSFTLSSAAFLALSAFFLVLIVKNLTAPRTVPLASMRLRPGATLPLAFEMPPTTQKTLVMALSTGCAYCKRSAPFYRALLQESHPDIKVVAVFQQSVLFGKSYITQYGFNVDDVLQGDFRQLGINSTPTLLLLDNKKRIQQLWVGELSTSEQSDVAERVGLKLLPVESSSTASPQVLKSPLISHDELVESVKANDKVVILDVRDRYRFAYGHLDGAINIPADELPIRAPHELPIDKQIAIYCNFSAACSAAGNPSYCSIAQQALQSAGFRNTRVIRDPLTLLSDKLAIVGHPSEPESMEKRDNP